MINKKDLKDLKTIFKEGTNIELFEMAGEDMPIGLKGKVRLVDDIGQIHVNWENGSTLALNTDLDKFSIL